MAKAKAEKKEKPITLKKLPGSLSFVRGSLLTDATFYDEMPNGQLKPLLVFEHGIRGTQNVNKESNVDSTNIQTTQSAKTAQEAKALVIKFGVSFLPLKDVLFASSKGTSLKDEEYAFFKESLHDFTARASESKGLQEVANRYARNILNGRWLWRNKTIANTVTINVSLSDNDLCTDVDALSIPLNHFDDYSLEEIKLGEVIAKGLSGEEKLPQIEVSARLTFPVSGAIEVYPSQNYIEGLDKIKGFSRPLYFVSPFTAHQKLGDIKYKGQAALRDQKIGNAIRTIDTWYSEYPEFQKPIPVEPNGANLGEGKFFRQFKAGISDSAFSIAKNLNNTDPDSDRGMFMIAALIRGGVYSES